MPAEHITAVLSYDLSHAHCTWYMDMPGPVLARRGAQRKIDEGLVGAASRI